MFGGFGEMMGAHTTPARPPNLGDLFKNASAPNIFTKPETTQRLEAIENRVDRFEKLEARIDKLWAGLDRLEARFDRMEARLDRAGSGSDRVNDRTKFDKIRTERIEPDLVFSNIEHQYMRMSNEKIRAQNRQSYTNSLRLLKKTKPGHNHDHLKTIAPPGDYQDIPYQLTAKIGHTPTKSFDFLSRLPYNSTGQEIAELILFYNEDFGIMMHDDLAARREKLAKWLKY